jgi:hypothetical protein
MKQSVNEYDFVKAFKECRPNNFSRAGLFALFDYLEQYEGEINENYLQRISTTVNRKI